jgi:hypothetical protein
MSYRAQAYRISAICFEISLHLLVCVSSSQGQHLVIANVGDSRAILATKDENEVLKAILLAINSKAQLATES